MVPSPNIWGISFILLLSLRYNSKHSSALCWFKSTLLLLLFCYCGCYYNSYTVNKCLSHFLFQIHVVVFVTVVVLLLLVGCYYNSYTVNKCLSHLSFQIHVVVFATVVVVVTCWLLLQLIHCKQMPESFVVSNPCCCFCHCCCCYYNLFTVKTYLSHLLFQVHVCLWQILFFSLKLSYVLLEILQVTDSCTMQSCLVFFVCKSTNPQYRKKMAEDVFLL